MQKCHKPPPPLWGCLTAVPCSLLRIRYHSLTRSRHFTLYNGSHFINSPGRCSDPSPCQIGVWRHRTKFNCWVDVMPKCIEHLKTSQNSLFDEQGHWPSFRPLLFACYEWNILNHIESGCQSVTSTLHVLHLASTQHPMRNDRLYFHPLSIVTKYMKTVRPYQTTFLWPRCPKMVYWSWFCCKHNSNTQTLSRPVRNLFAFQHSRS